LLDPVAKTFSTELPVTSLLKVNRKDLVITEFLKSQPWYATHFLPNAEHVNYGGTDESVGGPFVVSVVKMEKDGADSKEAYRAIVRTKKGDVKATCSVKSGMFSGKKIPVKEVLQEVFPVLAGKKMNHWKDPALYTTLNTFEERQLVRSYKFGVLYCAAGQKDEEKMFQNVKGSADWEEFLDAIGKRIALQGWTSYRAGLDVKTGATGKDSVYTKFNDYEVMYHVSTMLPYFPADTQQVERKRHLGNDIVVIVFKEGSEPFDPGCIKSEFNHIFAVVQKMMPAWGTPGKTYYRVAIGVKEGVPSFKPELPSECIFEKGDEFREFLLCKLINGEMACYEAPAFKLKIQRTRLALLKEILNNFSK